MGQSLERARVTFLSNRGTKSQVNLARLPQELLVLILSWVPGRILVTTGRLVCRQWRDLIDGPVIWKLQAERDSSQRQAIWAALEAAQRCPRVEWARVGVLQPFRRNLIKNPRVLQPPRRNPIRDLIKTPRMEEYFPHWQVRLMYGGCTRENTLWISQLVDLVKEGLWEDLLDVVQPDIFISDWCGTHEKCDRNYNICVLLLAADKESVIARLDSAPSRWKVPFQQASHVFRKYGPGVRYLLFRRIRNYPRAEPTEADIGNSTVLVKLPVETPSY